MINSGNIAITVRQSDVAIELPNGDIVLISHHDWLHVASSIAKLHPHRPANTRLSFNPPADWPTWNKWDALAEQDEQDRLDDIAGRKSAEAAASRRIWLQIQAEDYLARTGCTMRQAYDALRTGDNR